jgi:predicted LPLAT superfamily acyltransferase
LYWTGEYADAAAQLVMTKPVQPRNPGPSWGYQFLRGCDRVLPEFIFKPLRAAGTFVSVMAMGAQRRHSRQYLRQVLGREPGFIDVFRHFFAFEESLMLKLRVANGRPHATAIAPGSEHFKQYLHSGKFAFLGTFHVGRSDLMGFLLGPTEQHRVFMVRQRVGNSHDTERLGAMFGNWLTFIWVNEPENLLFALKDAVAAGGSIAMKCDRIEFSAKVEHFDFLGTRRAFPFTIYHLALIFDLPVMLSVGMPGGPSVSVLHSSPIWAPDRSLSKAKNLFSAKAHFQAFLQQLEGLLKAQPYLWFNFMELNPAVEPASPVGAPSAGKAIPLAT